MRKLIDRLEENYNDTHEVRMVMSRAALDQVIPLLEEIKYLGDVGASRTIRIEDWDEKGRRSVFGIDGDGASKIESIESKMIRSADK